MKRVVLAMVLCCSALLLPANALATTTVPFSSIGAEQTFEVPAGVYEVGFVAIGGSGGEASGVAGGEAAVAEGNLDVEQFQTLYVEVGGNGQSQAEGGAGGFNGGGSASGGGGGGGASDIRTSPRADGLSPDTRKVAAAGGGGAAGAGPEGEGGKGGAAAEAGETSTGGNEGGGAGTTVGGGGAFGCGGFGETGLLGLGGNGGSGESTNGGGGGGGGFWGGGGGGGGCTFGGGGGGGGSTLLPAFALMTLTSAGPEIDISYNPPPSIMITTPAEEAAYTEGEAINANYNCLPGEGTSVKTCAGPVANGAPLETATVGEQEFLVKAEDNDKGKAGKSVSYTVVAPPSIEIESPAEEATYTQGQVVPAAYECLAAEGATLESCSGPVASGVAIDTATPGNHDFSVTAVDDLGGETTKSASYTVVAPPSIEIESPAEEATYTQGQVVPAAYQCLAAAGASLESCSGPVASGVAIDTATPGNHDFSVTAVDDLGGETTKSASYTVVAPPPAPKSSNVSPALPDTTIGSHPKKTVKTKKKKTKVKFSFSSDPPGATFQCKLDKGSFAPCTPPKTYKVKKGSHTFSVEAVAPGGTDATPATFNFKVKKKK